MNLLFGLITSSIVGSVVFFTLLLLRLITGKVFSKTWHYYCLLVPLIFLLGGTHIAINLAGFMQKISPSPTPQEMPTGTLYEVIMSPVLDNLLDTTVHNGETDVGIAIAISITSQLITHLERTAPFLLTLWLMGTIIFMVINTKKYLEYSRAVLHNVKTVNDIDCKIPIVTSSTAHTPMLIGVIKPIIVLPNIHFVDKELDMILAHEMVHYRRKDLFVKLLMLISNAVHWFNPAAYVLNRQLNTACELSCDEKVVSEMDTQNRVFYGETILKVLKHSTAQRSIVDNVAFATNLCNSKKNTKRRLTSMMNTKRMRKSVAALSVAAGVLVVGGGFAISNMLDSVMPVYASEIVHNDTQTDEITQNQFKWPVDGYTTISSPFGININPISGIEEFHTGIDIPAPGGTPILATSDGYVIFSDMINGFGNMVIIYHGDGISTMYAHASALHVEVDQFVRQGDHIADLGSTGFATGNHLHFEVRINGSAIDPLVFLAEDEESRQLRDDLINRSREDRLREVPSEIEELESSRKGIDYVIDYEERNMTFELEHVYFEDYPAVQPVTFDMAAKIAADAIYTEFGISINGMDGYMLFVDNIYNGMTFWSGFILSEELTAHSMSDELFHFVIDSVTGEVLSLYMNTEETPFHG